MIPEIDSILTSIKKLLGPTAESGHFDPDIIIHINSAFSTLTQIGLGPKTGFIIRDSSALWTNFLQEEKTLESVKTYVYLKVRLIFDPPQSAAAIASMEKMASELEWRLNVAGDKH